jgi:hypothetical protein
MMLSEIVCYLFSQAVGQSVVEQYSSYPGIALSMYATERQSGRTVQDGT